jgi:hypothetical protein
MFSDGPFLTLSDIWNTTSDTERPLTLNQNQRYVGSGKSGISLYLSFLSASGILQNRFDEVFCPPWMGSWVYATMLNHAYPTLSFSSKTRIIHMYHQFGFLQNIDEIKNYAEDRKLIVLEDCAHMFGIEGSELKFGSNSHFSVFSPPKFVPSPPIGVVQSSDKSFLDYVDDLKGDASSINSSLNVLNRIRLDHRLANYPRKSSNYVERTQQIASKMYSTYPYTPLETKLARRKMSALKPEYELRILRLEKIYESIPNELLPKHSPSTAKFVPFKVPFEMTSDQFQELTMGRFQAEANFGSVHFDFNQNMLNPSYRRAACIRIHSGISDSQLELQLSEILRVLKRRR